MKKPSKPINPRVSQKREIDYYDLQTVVNIANKIGKNLKDFRIEKEYEYEPYSDDRCAYVYLVWDEPKFSAEEFKVMQVQYKAELNEYNTWLKRNKSALDEKERLESEKAALELRITELQNKIFNKTPKTPSKQRKGSGQPKTPKTP